MQLSSGNMSYVVQIRSMSALPGRPRSFASRVKYLQTLPYTSKYISQGMTDTTVYSVYALFPFLLWPYHMVETLKFGGLGRCVIGFVVLSCWCSIRLVQTVHASCNACPP